MPRFAFEAIAPSGTILRGTMEARSSANALEQLVAGGQIPVSLREASGREGILARLVLAVGFGSFDHVLMLRELGVLLKAGMSVERALVVLQNVAPSTRTAMRLGQILERVRAGETLSQSFGALVGEAPAYVSRLMAAGEASGQLGDLVVRVAAGLARAKELRDRLISGLTYPAVLVVAMGIVLWIVFNSVIPRLTPMLDEAGASLPVVTQALLAVAAFLNSYGWFLLLAHVCALGAVLLALRRPQARLVIDRFLLDNPLMLDLPQRYEAARFCRNLQTLLDGGLSLERALAASRDGSANSWFKARMTGVQSAVAEGEPLRAAFARSSVLPALVTEFAAVGEETGRLAAMMGEVAQIMDHDVETRLDRLTSLVVPAATLAMGGLVGAIMAGVVSGILAVNDLAR